MALEIIGKVYGIRFATLNSGWWFGTFLFFHRLGIIIPTDKSPLHTTGWWWLEHEFYDFPYIGNNHHPNWRTPSFFRGVGQPPTRTCYAESPLLSFCACTACYSQGVSMFLDVLQSTMKLFSMIIGHWLYMTDYAILKCRRCTCFTMLYLR